MVVSRAESRRAFNSGLDIVNQHRPTMKPALWTLLSDLNLTTSESPPVTMIGAGRLLFRFPVSMTMGVSSSGSVELAG